MSDADALNRILERDAPAVARCLSPLGRRAVLPRGIPVQSAEAANTAYNGTIGQVTDGHGNPLPLRHLAERTAGLDPAMALLYSPLAGHAPLREAWAARQRRHAGGSTAPSTIATVTHGITQGISHVAALFADPDTDVLVTDPVWGNTHLVFTLHAGARMVPYPFYDGEGFNVAGLARRLEEVRGKAIVCLNFPSNPTGYMPTPDEVRAIVDVLRHHRGPLVVLVDDSYHGMVYEPDRARRSVYWDLAEALDPERAFVVRADGATKEFLFFPGRVGFLSHGLPPDAAEALRSKLLCVARGTVGAPPGPSQAMVLSALRDPTLEDQIAERIALLRRRYAALRDALAAVRSARLTPFPFNAGCFALVRVDAKMPVDAFRRRLIADHDVGVIAFPTVGAIRIAFCSMDEERIPEAVARIARAVEAA